MKSYQNLVLLQNLYRLKAIGFEYIDNFNINEKTSFYKPVNLEELSSNISTCHLCDLNKSRKQSMPGYGNENAQIMIIDFSVSQNQDSTNTYYNGKAGEILQNMIKKVIGVNIDDVFLTHCVKCKTLNSNKPSLSECNSCKSYLYSQIEFINPKIIISLGEEAYTYLTGNSDDFEHVRGHTIEYKGVKLIPIYHPLHLLRNPHLKKTTLNDLQTIRTQYNQIYTQIKSNPI